MNPAVLFIIPLKAQGSSRDWRLTNWLLNRTLASIENQSSENHFTFIVCNEPPRIQFNTKKTRIIMTDIQIEGEFTAEKGYANKQQKMLRGLIDARGINPDRTMFVDADDLIHADIVNYVEKQPRSHAQIVNLGYRHALGQDRLRKFRNFHNLSGSTTIAPFAAEHLLEVRSDQDYMRHHLTFIHHVKPMEEVLAKKGIPFTYVPYHAVIYTRGSGDSLRDRETCEIRSGTLTLSSQRSFPGKMARRLYDFSHKIHGRLVGDVRIDAEIRDKFRGL